MISCQERTLLRVFTGILSGYKDYECPFHCLMVMVLYKLLLFYCCKYCKLSIHVDFWAYEDKSGWTLLFRCRLSIRSTCKFRGYLFSWFLF